MVEYSPDTARLSVKFQPQIYADGRRLDLRFCFGPAGHAYTGDLVAW